MFSSALENQLIEVGVVDLLQDYCAIQPDIDETKVKAAALVAQNIDVKRVLTQANLDRCVDPQNEADESLKALVIPAWLYFTYTRLIKMFQGNFTDGGLVTEVESEGRLAAKSMANEMQSIAETYLTDVVAFLNAENPSDPIDETKLTPKIRVFGGNEYRASN